MDGAKIRGALAAFFALALVVPAGAFQEPAPTPGDGDFTPGGGGAVVVTPAGFPVPECFKDWGTDEETKEDAGIEFGLGPEAGHLWSVEGGEVYADVRELRPVVRPERTDLGPETGFFGVLAILPVFTPYALARGAVLRFEPSNSEAELGFEAWWDEQEHGPRVPDELYLHAEVHIRAISGTEAAGNTFTVRKLWSMEVGEEWTIPLWPRFALLGNMTGVRADVCVRVVRRHPNDGRPPEKQHNLVLASQHQYGYVNGQFFSNGVVPNIVQSHRAGGLEIAWGNSDPFAQEQPSDPSPDFDFAILQGDVWLVAGIAAPAGPTNWGLRFVRPALHNVRHYMHGNLYTRGTITPTDLDPQAVDVTTIGGVMYRHEETGHADYTVVHIRWFHRVRAPPRELLRGILSYPPVLSERWARMPYSMEHLVRYHYNEPLGPGYGQSPPPGSHPPDWAYGIVGTEAHATFRPFGDPGTTPSTVRQTRSHFGALTLIPPNP